jgi:hypothetical protein
MRFLEATLLSGCRSTWVGVVAVYETNLLEDDVGAEVALERTAGEEGGHQQSRETVTIRLASRGFEVKTTKLVLGKER